MFTGKFIGKQYNERRFSKRRNTGINIVLHLVLKRQVAGSIPDGVIVIFQ